MGLRVAEEDHLPRIIHNKGPKAERDRLLFTSMYRSLCSHFWIKPLEDYDLAKLDNFALHRLVEDLYNRQKPKEQAWFHEKTSGKRSGKFRVRWFWRDLFHPETRVPKVPKLTMVKPQTGIPFVSAGDLVGGPG